MEICHSSEASVESHKAAQRWMQLNPKSTLPFPYSLMPRMNATFPQDKELMRVLGRGYLFFLHSNISLWHNIWLLPENGWLGNLPFSVFTISRLCVCASIKKQVGEWIIQFSDFISQHFGISLKNGRKKETSSCRVPGIEWVSEWVFHYNWNYSLSEEGEEHECRW